MILNKNEFTQEKYNELYEYCNNHNSYIEDKGEYYETVEIEIYVPTLDELKQEKLNFLDNETQKFIYSKYPIYKQLNIINPLNDYGEDDRNAMNEFINNVREKNHNFVEQINNCTTKEELELIKIEF